MGMKPGIGDQLSTQSTVVKHFMHNPVPAGPVDRPAHP